MTRFEKGTLLALEVLAGVASPVLLGFVLEGWFFSGNSSNALLLSAAGVVTGAFSLKLTADRRRKVGELNR